MNKKRTLTVTMKMMGEAHVIFGGDGRKTTQLYVSKAAPKYHLGE